MRLVPVYIPFDRVSDLMVVHYFGSGYTLAQVKTMAGPTAGPIRLCSVIPAPGCEAVFEKTVAEYAPEGSIIRIVPSGCTALDGNIQVVEPVTSNGTMLSEILLSKGLAIPDRALQGTFVKPDLYLAALRQARLEGRGFWHEYTASEQAGTLLGPLADTTVPPNAVMAPLTPLAITLVLSMLVGVGLRDRRVPQQRGIRRWANILFCGSKGSFR